jgi:predicted MFS family arabinose efflux permease
VWPFWAGGAALLGLYVAWALRRPHPAVDLALLRARQPALAVVLSALAAVVLFVMIFLVPVYMQSVQGVSALVAGLALLPQGLVTGVGIVLGDRLAARRGVRFSAALGMASLTVSTAAFLGVGAATPAWLIALLLSGRGLALGLTIQPLLNLMLEGLGPAQAADANTLFNVAQRLGGSIGIALLATFFQVREQMHVARALRALGLDAAALARGGGAAREGGLATLPPAARAQLADAAAAGFHDTVWLLVALAALGLAGALLLRPGRAIEPESGDGAADAGLGG